MNLAGLLTRSARVWGDRPFTASGTGTTLTYAAGADLVARLAHGLGRRHGLRPGDTVAIATRNSPHFLPALFALWHAGLVAVPVNAKLHAREMGWILDNAEARLCLCDDAIAAALSAERSPCPLLVMGGPDWLRLAEEPGRAMHDCRADDLAWLFYTSGTTGRPKGAMLSHDNLLAMTLAYFADIDAIAPDDCMIHAAPLSHGSGLYALPHVARGAANVVPESGGFEVDETLDLLRHWRGASLFMAPTMVKRLVEAPAATCATTPNLKTIVYGGGPMYLADMEAALARLGPKFAQIYGQGEAPMTITGMDRRHHVDDGSAGFRDRLASVGFARTGVEVAVLDAEDNPLPPGEIGEVAVRGTVVMRGYWRNAAASTAALRNGWLHTGDLGAFAVDGHLTLKDRNKDLIISGGSNIYPREVEEALLNHADVLEVAVIGRPHSEWGEEVVAFVVTRPGAPVDAAALDATCLAHIARFKRPKHYRFVAHLPKNNYGKVLKTELRNLV